MALRGKNAHYKIVEIQPRHFRALADRYPEAQAWPAMIELAGQVERAIKAVERLLPKGFAESVWAPTSKRTLEQAKSFLSSREILNNSSHAVGGRALPGEGEGRIDLARVTRLTSQRHKVLRREPIAWVASRNQLAWETEPLPIVQ